MKVYVNPSTHLVVINQETNEVLYEYNPFEGEITYLTEEKFKNSIINDIQGAYISGEVEK